MKQVIDTLRRIFRQAADWWLVIRPARFALIILLVGAFAFTGVEPAHDVFNGIAVGSSDGSGITITYSALLVGTLLWSFTVWATVYYAYQYVNLKPRQKSLHHEAWFLKVAKWILTVLPVFPFVIAAWGFWAADAKPQAGERIMSYLYPWILLVMGGVCLVVIRRFQKPLTLEPVAFNEWSWPLWTMLGVFALVFVLSFSLSVTLRMASVAVILVGLSGWTVMGMFASILRYRFFVPALEVILLWVVFCAFFNNNHTVDPVNKVIQGSFPQRPSDTTYFRNWVTTLAAETKNDSGPIPVYIVAGEGGGIRAAQWSLGILTRLDSIAEREGRRFYRHVFAFTGVSGSSIGFAFYQNLHQLNSTPARISADSLPAVANKIISNDFLSPLTAGLVFPDMVQRFLPFPVQSFSRARFLERTFVHHFTHEVQALTHPLPLKNLSDPFLQMCPAKLDSAVMPCFFFNSTHVETGRKALLSNVSLTDAYFYDALDVFRWVKPDVSLATTATISARFPLVTPPARMVFYHPETDCTVAHHFVDGGYFENTGLHTAFQVLRLAEEQLKKIPVQELPDSVKQRVKLVVLFLKNGSMKLNTKKLGWKYETAPLRAFVGAWDRRSAAQAYDMEKLVPKMSDNARMITFTLNRNDVSLPTTWYIAPRGRDAIRKSIADELRQIDKKGLFATPKSADGQ